MYKKKIMIYFLDLSFMEEVSQYMYNYALILQIVPKKQHVQVFL